MVELVIEACCTAYQIIKRSLMQHETVDVSVASSFLAFYLLFWNFRNYQGFKIVTNDITASVKVFEISALLYRANHKTANVLFL